jgi:hypothetical protein
VGQFHPQGPVPDGVVSVVSRGPRAEAHQGPSSDAAQTGKWELPHGFLELDRRVRRRGDLLVQPLLLQRMTLDSGVGRRNVSAIRGSSSLLPQVYRAGHTC